MGVMFTNLAIVWGPRIVPTESYRENKLLILRIPGYSPLIKYGNAKCTSFLHGGFLSHGVPPVIIQFSRDFPWNQPASHWGSPETSIPLPGLTGPDTLGHYVEGDHTACATLRIPKTGFYAVRTYENMRWYTIETQKLDWTKASSHPISHDIRDGC